MTDKKIKNLKDISLISSKLKNKKKIIVLCHGVFDLLHNGHINHFKEAKRFGDILIVSITKDEFIKKGFNRPIFKVYERAGCISALEAVDYVVVSPSESAENVINLIKPNYYVKGTMSFTHSSTKTICIPIVVFNPYFFLASTHRIMFFFTRLNIFGEVPIIFV